MRTAALSEVCHIAMGQAPRGASYNNDGDGYPLLAGAGDFGEDSPKPSKFTTEPSKLSAPGDILLCVRATIGDLNWSDKEYCLGRGVAGLRPKNGDLDRNYLWRWLSFARPELEKRGRGSTFKQVSRKDIADLEIVLPESAKEQRRIASILDKGDAIRRKRRKLATLADDLLKSAYVHTVGYLSPDYYAWTPQRIEQIAEGKKGSMRTGPFGSALLHSEFVDEGVAVLGIDNAVQNCFAWDERRFITKEKYEELKRYRVFPRDVLITIMGTTGRSAVVPDDIPEAITTKHLATITCDLQKVLPEFLSFAIHSDPQIIRQIEKANKGAIMDGLNLSIIRKLEINVPPLEKQENFVRALRILMRVKEQSGSSHTGGDELLASLSQRAFHGEI